MPPFCIKFRAEDTLSQSTCSLHAQKGVFFHTSFCFEVPIRHFFHPVRHQSPRVACKHIYSSHPQNIVRISRESSSVGSKCFSNCMCTLIACCAHFFTFSRNSTHMNHQCNGAWTVLRNSCGRDVRSMSTNQTKTICFPFDHKFPEDWPRAMVNANLMMSPPALGRGPRWAHFFFARETAVCALCTSQ